MQVIPVVDVRGGEAVAAVRGDRASYRPIETPLASSSDPVAVAQGLAALFPFLTLYVADLDGIEGRGADLATQHRLAEAWPGAELWIDDGTTGLETTNVGVPPTTRGPAASHAHDAVPPPLRGRLGGGEPRHSQSSTTHVIGSESLASLDLYQAARDRAGPDAPLSLDFRGDAFVGPPEILERVDLWPRRVIVMTLARVGSGEGPDIERLSGIVARAGDREIYAAGGVRHGGDLSALRDAGVAGALVATALHRGGITLRDLDRLGAV